MEEVRITVIGAGVVGLAIAAYYLQFIREVFCWK
jgi:glycine/D-amino acid oxidase-like deaminating enzyme